MRNYWLRIMLGAVGIFVVGMLIVQAIRAAQSGVEELSEGTGPITIPLAFVPFEIDGQRAGTLRRVRVFRDSLQEPTRLEVLVSVPDSSAIQRFAACILAIEEQDSKVQPNDFRCLAAGDTAGRDLVQFGDLELRGYPGTYALYAPREHIEHLKQSSESSLTAEEARARAEADSLRDLQLERADSLREFADSVHQASMELADSLRRAAIQQSESLREGASVTNE
jgi:hypothetical protein